jgi:hypothetical protein
MFMMMNSVSIGDTKKVGVALVTDKPNLISFITLKIFDHLHFCFTYLRRA